MEKVTKLGIPLRAAQRQALRTIECFLVDFKKRPGSELVSEYISEIERDIGREEELLHHNAGGTSMLAPLFAKTSSLSVRYDVRCLRKANLYQWNMLLSQWVKRSDVMDFFTFAFNAFDQIEERLDHGDIERGQLILEEYFRRKNLLGICLVS